MVESGLNALAGAASSYLRSAMRQPVQWREWGDAAFAVAAAEDKPVLLDIGAVWCHWCHVMDGESYENADIAAIINEHFVAIKVDRDERPDVDARYQAAVAAISGQGGWPLTAFLTPDGRPYFGGTYFPPDDRYGRPGLKRVLLTMAESFYQQRGDVEESAGSVMEAIESSETFAGEAADLDGVGASAAIAAKLVDATLQQYDPVHGGFGAQPKFAHPLALDLLLDEASRSTARSAAAAEAVLLTLRKMYRGGIFDQLGGGFHRYSVDERWVVPHFEKMAYDNAPMLLTYVRAFQTFAEPALADTARSVLQWMNEHLADRARGGFYSSQDADVLPDDDGNFYTWTQAEAAAVLQPEEMRLAAAYFDLGSVGDMHHDPARNVLFCPMTMAAAAMQAGVDADLAPLMVKTIRAKLLAARGERRAPFIDRTMYTGWNAMCVSAFVAAGRVLQLPGAIEFARRSLGRALREAVSDGHVQHVIAYGHEEAPHTAVAGMLDDHVLLGHACMDLWEATGEPVYVQRATEIADVLLHDFYDGRAGGFFDTAQRGEGKIGALATKRKPIQDAPTAAGNPNASALLLRLHEWTGKDAYRETAQETLEAFAGVVEHLGLNAATFGLALRRLQGTGTQVVILGDGVHAAQMEAAALAGYAVDRTVVRLRNSAVEGLPGDLAARVAGIRGPAALVCSGQTCSAPARDVPSLLEALHGSGAS